MVPLQQNCCRHTHKCKSAVGEQRSNKGERERERERERARESVGAVQERQRLRGLWSTSKTTKTNEEDEKNASDAADDDILS